MAPNSSASETTPLLATSAEVPTLPVNDSSIIKNSSSSPTENEGAREARGQFYGTWNRNQIFLLCFARLVEPIAFFSIFPFVNKMIQTVGGLEETDVGFYSGVIESAFSLTQMLLMISWGRAADRIGRKPVLILSLTGVGIAVALFGLSTAIWQMVLFRCCAGIFAGTIVTVRTMITENSTQATQARAFSFFAFAGNLGIFLGPLLGGGLAEPAENIGGIFQRISFFKNFPYALPTFVSGIIGLSAAITCGLFVKETLKKKDKSDTSPPHIPITTVEILRSPGVPYVLFIYGQVMLLGLAYTAVSPVFWFTEPSLGGYGFSIHQISYFLGGIGVSQAIWLLFLFPVLQREYGTGMILKWCLYAWPGFFASCPMCNWFLRRGWTTAFWVVAPTLQIMGSGVAMAFTGVQLALNDISPSPTSLGTLNSLALTLTSGIRTVGPAIFTSIFAAGARSQFLGGYLVWFFLVAVALVGPVAMLWYDEQTGPGRLKQLNEGESEDEE